MITSARSIARAPNPFVAMMPRLRLTRDSSWRILGAGRPFWGWEMATVATRAPKRELAPDWREALATAVRRFAIRSWGAMLLLLSLAAVFALATHNPTDPSLSTAAGGPPTNWIGSPGAYFSDALLLLFGIGSILFLPVVAIAGLRMLRVEPAGHTGRGLLVAAIGALPARHGARTDQRLGRFRSSGRMGRSIRARRRTWSQLGFCDDRQSRRSPDPRGLRRCFC